MAKDSLSKSLKLLEEMQNKPKTFTAQLMKLVPLIDDLMADGHTRHDIMVVLKDAGIVFNEGSFKTSLQRARNNLRRKKAVSSNAVQPDEGTSEFGTQRASVPTNQPSRRENPALQTPSDTSSLQSRIVKPQPIDFVSHKKDPENSDFL